MSDITTMEVEVELEDMELPEGSRHTVSTEIPPSILSSEGTAPDEMETMETQSTPTSVGLETSAEQVQDSVVVDAVEETMELSESGRHAVETNIPPSGDGGQEFCLPLSITVNEKTGDGKEVPTKLWIYPGNLAPSFDEKKTGEEEVDETSETHDDFSNLQIQTTESESTILFQVTNTTTPSNQTNISDNNPNAISSQEGAISSQEEGAMLSQEGAISSQEGAISSQDGAISSQEEGAITLSMTANTVFSCNLCDFVTEHKHNLKTHMLVHTKPTVKEFYKCEECDYITPLKYNLKTHMKKHAKLQDLSENDIYRCKDCDYVSAYKHDLQTHVKKHAPEKQFKCDKCEFSSIYKHSLIHHVASKHNRERPHKCAQCKYSSARKQDLVTHMGKHAEEKPFRCQLCDYGTPYKQSFKAHMNRHLGNKMHKCEHDGCGFSTTTAQNLKSHLSRHSDVKQHQCRFCDYSASHKTQLTNHEAKHGVDETQVKSPRKFTCTMCDYETTHKYSLKRHIERHAETRVMPEKVFRCEECGYQTGYKSSLKRHLAKHSDVKPFKCGHCEYSAINMTQMHVHIAKHTGIKPFKCTQCDYATANKQHLVGHMAKHSDVRYKCPLCEFSTAWKQRLTIHLKQHQLGGIGPFRVTAQGFAKVSQPITQEQPESVAIMPESVQQIYNTETNEALSQLSNAIAAFHDYMQEPSSQDSEQSQSEGVAEQQPSVTGTSEVIVASAMSGNRVLLQQVQLISEGDNQPVGSSDPQTMQQQGERTSPDTEMTGMSPVATVITHQQGEVVMFSPSGLNQAVASTEMAGGELPGVVIDSETTVVGETGAVEQNVATDAETSIGETSGVAVASTDAETVIGEESCLTESTVVTGDAETGIGETNVMEATTDVTVTDTDIGT